MVCPHEMKGECQPCVRASRLRLAKELVQEREPRTADHACAACVGPRSESYPLVVEGFVCAWHEARRIVAEEGE